MGSNLGKQATRQAARRAAAEAQANLMRARLERDRRCAALGVQVVAALRERDAHVARCERLAGEALRALIVDEGVGVAEATQWCAGSVSAREVARLRRLGQADPDADRERPGAAPGACTRPPPAGASSTPGPAPADPEHTSAHRARNEAVKERP